MITNKKNRFLYVYGHIYVIYCVNIIDKLVFRRYIVICILALFTASGYSQRVYIHGKVTNENHEPVEFATVNEEHFLIGTITNLKGEYNITLQSRDTISLVFKMVGHETRKRALYDPKDTVQLDVMMPTSGYALQGVTISDTKRQTETIQTITKEGLKFSPDAGGGSVESIIATQAGVSSHNELSSQYNVRGGNFDENSVWVNGVEILRPMLVRAGQQEGLSFINPDMVESIGFSTGGFEAKYGDRMSSVLDITYRRPQGFESSLSASLLGSSAFIGIGNDRFSFSGSLRYKTNRSLLNTMDTEGEYDPSFLDYQTYASWTPNDKWDISFIGNAAVNRYNFTPTTRKTTFGTAKNPKQFLVYFDGWETDQFNTLFGAFDIHRKFNEFNSLTLNLSAFDSDEKESYDIISEYWLDNIDPNQLFSVGGFMEHARNHLSYSVINATLRGDHRIESHNLKWGMEIKHEYVKDRMREWEARDSAGYTLPYRPGSPLDITYSLKSQNEMSENRISAFVQDNWKHSFDFGFASINGGIRASYWRWNDELIVSPRLSIGLVPSFNDNFTFRFATGVYYQAPFYKELKDTISAGGMSYVRLNKDIRSQKSLQFILGCDYLFRVFDRPFKFTTEIYYKKLSNLIPYNLDNVRIVYYGENVAHGYATGIDMKLFGEFVPGTDSWITLSLMKTEEKINCKWIPRPSDQLFNMSLFFTDYFPGTDKWKMTLKGSFSDGLPFGPSHSGREDALFRAPAYKRVDMGMSYRLLNNEKGNQYYGLSKYFKNIWIGLDCFNLLGINNVNSYYWVTDINNTQYAVPNYLTGRQFNLKILLELGN